MSGEINTIFYIVRTQGKRPKLLTEAIKSIQQQAHQKRIVIINHSRNLVDFDSKDNIRIISLEDTHKKRGAPLNLGLKWVYENCGDNDGVAFLDDDDIFYPNFAKDLCGEIQVSQTDFAYGKTKKKIGQQEPVLAFEKKPIFELLVNNYIPINAFVIRLTPLKSKNIFFDESMDFLEDWKFLVSLYLKGLRVSFCDRFVSEFRVHEDGTNSLTVETARLWKECEKDIENFIKNNFKNVSADDFYNFVYALREKRELSLMSVPIKQIELKLSTRIKNKFVRVFKKIFFIET